MQRYEKTGDEQNKSAFPSEIIFESFEIYLKDKAKELQVQEIA